MPSLTGPGPRAEVRVNCVNAVPRYHSCPIMFFLPSAEGMPSGGGKIFYRKSIPPPKGRINNGPAYSSFLSCTITHAAWRGGGTGASAPLIERKSISFKTVSLIASGLEKSISSLCFAP